VACLDPSYRPRVLVVDDDEDFRDLLIRLLAAEEPREIDSACSAAEARGRLARCRYDVVITDLAMPGESGLSLMRWAQEACPEPAWIVLTGRGTLDAAVEALQLGAFDFLEKPLASDEPVRNSVRNALSQQRLLSERAQLQAELQESHAELSEHVKELERAYRLLRDQADAIRADLHRAGIIQRALLPHVAPRLPGFQVQAVYRPSHSVGGDLYDVVRLDERHASLLIADAAGHGLSAALLAVLFRSQLPLVDPETALPLAPSETLRAANRALCTGFPTPGLFLTAAHCVLDTQTRRLSVASAGHPPVLLLRQGGGVERISHTGPALGLFLEADYAEQEITLETGDRLLFYTDGLYDRLPPDEGSASNAIATLLGQGGQGGEALLRLLGSANAEEPPEDDVTLLLLEATAGESRLDNGDLPPPPSVAPARTRFEILMSSEPHRTTFSIQGRADWAVSAAFHDACLDALEAGQGVMMDLTLCQYLDSTFLGTLHELSERADRADVELRLQGVTPLVMDLFAELGMERVMERIVPSMLPLPMQMSPLASEADREARTRLTLQAHENLAALSERNRREFDPLLTLLRKEAETEPS